MIHNVSIPAALIAGLVSFLSPCVLPLVPPYLVYLTGATIEHVANEETVSSSRRAVMISAALFVLGFSTVFVALGASASLIGGLIRAWSAELSIAAGIVIIVMGLHFLGLTRIGLLMREGRLPIPKPVGLWGHPLDRGRRSYRREGRRPARSLFGRARHSLPDRGLHGRTILLAVCKNEAPSGERRAGDGRVDDLNRHRLPHRRGHRRQHLAVGDVSSVAEFWLDRIRVVGGSDVRTLVANMKTETVIVLMFSLLSLAESR
jgi:hypothetical protein